jgi:hypothetical protein
MAAASVLRPKRTHAIIQQVYHLLLVFREPACRGQGAGADPFGDGGVRWASVTVADHAQIAAR